MLLNTGQSKAINNYFFIKQYNDNSLKLVIFKNPISNQIKEKKVKSFKNQNDEKLDCNISRTRSKVFEYAMCNQFEYFITITLDRKKVVDRYDLDLFIKNLGQFIRNERRKTGNSIDYLLLPEEHKDGAWHMHGLIKGIDGSNLRQFKTSDYLPKHMNKMILEGRELYNWIPYADKFGFVSLEKIKDTERVSKYITKYISKDLTDTQKKRKYKKLYYSSRGLNVAKKIKEGSWSAKIKLPSKPFENDYVQILDLNYDQYLELALQL